MAGHIPGHGWGCQPVNQDRADVSDARLCRTRLKLSKHAGRGIDVDHLAAAQGQWQTDPFSTATHVDHDIVWLYIGRHDLQVGVKVTARISAKALRHRAAKAVCRRLLAVEAATPGMHGIKKGRIGLGRSHR
jgi:hypothetical protein